MNAHYEALRLEADDHRSATHLTFVGAIEGYGMQLVPDEICDCQDHGPHPKGVAEKRFRKALQTVRSNREVKRLAGPAYDARSHTGHRGTLFSSEPTLGFTPARLFDMTADVDFDDGVLAELRTASRKVLTKALADHGPNTEG